MNWRYFLRYEDGLCVGKCCACEWPCLYAATDWQEVDEATHDATDIYMHCQQCDQQLPSRQLTQNAVFGLRVCAACNAKLPQELCEACEGCCYTADDEACPVCSGKGYKEAQPALKGNGGE